MFLKKLTLIILILIFFLILSIWCCVHLGGVQEISFREINAILWAKVAGKNIPETPIYTIVWDIRLPRIILAALVGACLSLAGASLQGILRNPLADPYMVGVSSGAALGGVLAIILNLGIAFAGLNSITLCAFLGALLAMLAVYRLSMAEGKLPVETFLLAGVIVGSFLWAMVSFLLTVSGKSMQQMIFWLMGSTSQANWNGIGVLSIYTVAGFAGLMVLSHPLNVLTLGDEAASHLGVAVEKVKILVIFFASAVTGAAVSLAGLIGFVGLMIPHVARMIFGADNRVLIPVCGVGGAIFLVWVDTAARSVFAPGEVPVGVLTALIGAPFFLYILKKRKRNL